MKCDPGPDPVQVASVLAALLQCQRHVCAMTEFARNLKDGMKKMTAFKMTLKKPKIAEFALHLEEAKTTLLLAISVATFMLP